MDGWDGKNNATYVRLFQSKIKLCVNMWRKSEVRFTVGCVVVGRLEEVMKDENDLEDERKKRSLHSTWNLQNHVRKLFATFHISNMVRARAFY